MCGTNSIIHWQESINANGCNRKFQITNHKIQRRNTKAKLKEEIPNHKFQDPNKKYKSLNNNFQRRNTKMQMLNTNMWSPPTPPAGGFGGRWGMPAYAKTSAIRWRWARLLRQPADSADEGHSPPTPRLRRAMHKNAEAAATGEVRVEEWCRYKIIVGGGAGVCQAFEMTDTASLAVRN